MIESDCFPPAHRRSRVLQSAAGAIMCALIMCSVSARAEVNVQGDVTAVRVVANHAQISEVLDALSRNLSVRYKASIKLDGTINGEIKGDLDHVLSRILQGYNYVISTREGVTTLLVIGRSGDPPVTVGAPQMVRPRENTNPAAQWRASTPLPQKP